MSEIGSQSINNKLIANQTDNISLSGNTIYIYETSLEDAQPLAKSTV